MELETKISPITKQDVDYVKQIIAKEENTVFGDDVEAYEKQNERARKIIGQVKELVSELVLEIVSAKSDKETQEHGNKVKTQAPLETGKLKGEVMKGELL